MSITVKPPIIGYHTDEIGTRAKIGVIVPATNTTVQPEMEAMRPAGVSNHVSRMFLPPRPYADMAEYKRLLETEEGQIDEAIRLVMLCEPAVIAEGHSIHSFRGTVADGYRQRDELQEKAGGIPFWTPSTAVLAGLEAFGSLKKISVLTPYWPPADEMIANFMRSAGYDVVGSGGLRAQGPTNVARIPAERVFEGFRMVDHPDAEALVQVGTALPMAGFTDQLEREFGKPVIGVNVATYWAALRSIGITDRIQGFGRLLAEF
jgi:maleate isomerase